MAEMIEAFQRIVGGTNVLTREMDTAYYRSGFRCGFGEAVREAREGGHCRQ